MLNRTARVASASPSIRTSASAHSADQARRFCSAAATKPAPAWASRVATQLRADLGPGASREVWTATNFSMVSVSPAGTVVRKVCSMCWNRCSISPVTAGDATVAAAKPMVIPVSIVVFSR